jgi:hypothetical protein
MFDDILDEDFIEKNLILTEKDNSKDNSNDIDEQKKIEDLEDSDS